VHLYSYKKNELWVSTYGGGLNKLNLRTGENIIFNNLPNADYAIQTNNVWEVLRDSLNYLWIVSLGEGVFCCDLANYDIKHYYFIPRDSSSIANNFSYDLLIDQKSRLWIPTFRGISNYDYQRDNFINYTLYSDSLDNSLLNNVQCMYQDNFGAMWAGTRSGLLQLDQNMQIKQVYTNKNGLLDNFVQAILGVW